MNKQYIEAVYPGSARLIYICETCPVITAMLRLDKEENVTPEQVVYDQRQDMLRRQHEGVREAPEILEQINHPDFLKYLRMKLSNT